MPVPGAVVAERRRKKGPPQAAPVPENGAPAPAGPFVPVPLEAALLLEDGVLTPAMRFAKVPATAAAFGGGEAAKGLVNTGNACYMAAVLQLLVHAAPFAHTCAATFKVASAAAVAAGQPTGPRAPVPGGVAGLLGRWMLEYWAARTTARPLPMPRLDKVKLNAGAAATGRLQEDAHEFLAALLSQCETDVAAAGIRPPEARQHKNAARPPSAGAKDSQGGRWLTVGRGKEKLTVRHEDGAPPAATAETDQDTPAGVLPRVCHGTLHVHTRGAQGTARNLTSVVVEPFKALVVPVSAATLVECLELSLAKESVERPDDASKSLTRTPRLGRLPPLLFVQLQRWAVTREGDTLKLDNVVRFAHRTVIPPKLQAAAQAAPVEYRLVGVVCHRGDAPGRGHYVTYLPDPAAPDAGLTLCNDGRITHGVAYDVMLRDTPYLLALQRVA